MAAAKCADDDAHDDVRAQVARMAMAADDELAVHDGNSDDACWPSVEHTPTHSLPMTFEDAPDAMSSDANRNAISAFADHVRAERLKMNVVKALYENRFS